MTGNEGKHFRNRDDIRAEHRASGKASRTTWRDDPPQGAATWRRLKPSAMYVARILGGAFPTIPLLRRADRAKDPAPWWWINPTDQLYRDVFNVLARRPEGAKIQRRVWHTHAGAIIVRWPDGTYEWAIVARKNTFGNERLLPLVRREMQRHANGELKELDNGKRRKMTVCISEW